MKTLKKSFIAFTGAAVQKADEKITLDINVAETLIFR